MYDSRKPEFDVMHDFLLFSESMLSWSVANYGCCSDPVRDPDEPTAINRVVLPPAIVLWALGSGVFLCVLAGFGWRQILSAGVIFCGTLLTRWLRRSRIQVRNLAELEIAASGLSALALWLIARNGQVWWTPSLSLPVSSGQCSVLALALAILIYMVRGGNYIVRGILKRAGGLPDSDDPKFETGEGYSHGQMIGQIERIIVVLVVMGGNLQALAFFFAAKGLIRSKELEERPRADYFLLGSLASFLVALVGGLILQRAILVAW